MAVTIDLASLVLSIASRTKSALDLTNTLDELLKTYSFSFTDGTGANKAKNHWHDQRTLAASASEDLDLAGGLTDAFGNVITFTKIKAIIVFAAAANTNDVVLGNAAANAWIGPFGAAAHTVAVKPGGIAIFIAPDANGYAVTAGTADILKVLNGGAGTSVTYDIFILGET